MMQIHKVDIPSNPIHLQIAISLFLSVGVQELPSQQDIVRDNFQTKLELLGIFAKHQRKRGKECSGGGNESHHYSSLSPQVSSLRSMDHKSSCCLWSWMEQSSQRDGALNQVEQWPVKRQDPSFALSRERNYLNFDKKGQRCQNWVHVTAVSYQNFTESSLEGVSLRLPLR